MAVPSAISSYFFHSCILTRYPCYVIIMLKIHHLVHRSANNCTDNLYEFSSAASEKPDEARHTCVIDPVHF